jgi:acyl-CoA synthetase (AMP-forming)/AMP-acid ligase II
VGVIELFDRGAALFPDRACLVERGVQRSYREVKARTLGISAGLAALRLPERSVAALYSPNCVAAYECMLGIYRSHTLYTPINARAHAAESVHILTYCEAAILFYHSSLEAQVSEFKTQCPLIRHYVCIDREGDHGPFLDQWIPPDFESFVPVARPRDALVSLHGTGGTTGLPKIAMFSSRIWDVMAANHLAVPRRTSHPVYLMAAPMTHAAGTVSIPLLSQGATIVIHGHFDAGEVLAAIEQHRVTHTYLPPTAIYMLLSAPTLRAHDYASLEAFTYAAAPMSVDRLRQCIATFGPVMMQFYGQTEAPMFCTCLLPEEHDVDDQRLAHRLLSCGRPMLLTELEIMDDDGRLLARGERGEIVVRGDLVMPGYLKNEAATAEASRFGWHHTGDVGHIDEDGFVYIVDRKKDMIISGGFNVYPSEIEQVIWSHPAVQECAVVGVPDDKWGEAVKAVIELKRGSSADAEEIIALCKSRLGSVKAPKSVEFWETLPRTPVGKVSKKDIRAGFWAGRDRPI